MLGDQNDVNDFLNSMVEKYIEGMRNAGPQGDVLWAGQIEIELLAKLFTCRIEIYQEAAMQETPTIVNAEEHGTVAKLVYCNGNHYKFIEPSTGKIVDTAPDGNCLFNAFLGATGQEQSIDEISMQVERKFPQYFESVSCLLLGKTLANQFQNPVVRRFDTYQQNLNAGASRLFQQRRMLCDINPSLSHEHLFDPALNDHIAQLLAPLWVREEVVVGDHNHVCCYRLQLLHN